MNELFFKFLIHLYIILFINNRLTNYLLLFHFFQFIIQLFIIFKLNLLSPKTQINFIFIPQFF